MKKIIILLLLLTLTSCSLIFPSRVLKRSGVFKSKGDLKVIKSNNKEQKILFLGMRHIGRKEFYDDVAKLKCSFVYWKIVNELVKEPTAVDQWIQSFFSY